jgi:hypothetical protein
MTAAAPAMAGMRRAERRDVMVFLSVPRLANRTAVDAVRR